MPEESAVNSGISEEIIRETADYSALAVTDKEVGEYKAFFDAVLPRLAQVADGIPIDTPETSRPQEQPTFSRPDVVADVLTNEEALANAPAAENGMFKVSSILGEEQ